MGADEAYTGPPMSISRIVAKTINPTAKDAHEGKTVVIVGTVTDDTRYVHVELILLAGAD